MFQWSNGSAVSYTDLHKSISRLTTIVGLDPTNYNTHSLRIGGATSMAILGFNESAIKELGRWKSSCFKLYCRAAPSSLRAVSGIFGVEADKVVSEVWFGGLPASRACLLDWDDFHNVSLFRR